MSALEKGDSQERQDLEGMGSQGAVENASETPAPCASDPSQGLEEGDGSRGHLPRRLQHTTHTTSSGKKELAPHPVTAGSGKCFLTIPCS